MSLLEKINSPSDLNKLSIYDLKNLAKELREFILEFVSTKEGHLGASLGVVELAVAIHYVFNTPDDKLVWDVGHQAYVHKLITGRKDLFQTSRQKGGISGFPKMSESEYDNFGTGHSSTSISAVLGMALSSKIKGESRNHIAVIGDASIASGMAFEGLNHAGVSNSNILVILNDNAMAIDPNVGALKEYLSSIKKAGNDSKNIFEALNFKYFGPFDGHDFDELLLALNEVKKYQGPKFLHVVTIKGKGYRNAEIDQVRFHAPGKFDLETGLSLKSVDVDGRLKYQDVFGKTIVEFADTDDKIVGITPAMPSGSSLKFMMDKYPERAFDVGIAEQHAVTLAAGIATQGLKPVVAIYSTFLQRAYDQVVHDVAIQNLPVVFCIDRGGVVGEDGSTHHGMLDLAWLRTIPNMTVSAPMNEHDLRNLMFTAINGDSPFAIRYPRGKGVLKNWQNSPVNLEIGKGVELKMGSDVAVLSIGHPGNYVKEAILQLDNNYRDKVGHYNMLFVKPLDEGLLKSVFNNYKTIITVEDGAKAGGFGSSILEWACLDGNNVSNRNIILLGANDLFLDHGKSEELHDEMGISADKIKEKLLDVLLKTVN
ncbi:MAG: 1-deoxy-D-xylulose-5-phosphate synthase [Flavobacteriales bacterium]|nr:1-deoxy-D-xylulose-5-phosphate synthase [Flavobacteriales bacterium]